MAAAAISHVGAHWAAPQQLMPWYTPVAIPGIMIAGLSSVLKAGTGRAYCLTSANPRAMSAVEANCTELQDPCMWPTPLAPALLPKTGLLPAKPANCLLQTTLMAKPRLESVITR